MHVLTVTVQSLFAEVVVGDTDVLQSIDVDISGDEDTFEDVVIIIVVVVVVVVVMEELVVSLEDAIDVTAVQKFIQNSVTKA